MKQPVRREGEFGGRFLPGGKATRLISVTDFSIGICARERECWPADSVERYNMRRLSDHLATVLPLKPDCRKGKNFGSR
jgi:hypothetical protein